MNYLLKSKPKSAHKVKIFLVVGLFVFLSCLSYFFPVGVRVTFQAIARPLWIVSEVITKPFHGTAQYFSFKNSLIKKNTALEEEIGSLKLKEIDYDLIFKENQDLKNQLGRSTTSDKIASRILSKPPTSPYDTLVVDTGSSEGVNLGNKVYSSDNVIVGLVTNVTPHTSLVRLFSSGGNKQESILSRTGASFVLVGDGGANLTLEVPKDTDILWGDVFTYPGISASTIATVNYIDTNSQSSFKTIYLRIPGNIFSNKWVFIERN
jgi:cell shape-determining protein MreC